jgi:hypothetical protein
MMKTSAITLVSENITDAVLEGRYTVGHVTADGQECDIVPEGMIYVSGAETLEDAIGFVSEHFKGWSLNLNELDIYMIQGKENNGFSTVHNRGPYRGAQAVSR